VNLDVTHFKPEEISVKVVGNQVTIEGKHEEREDDHGLIQRYFKRTYILPKVWHKFWYVPLVSNQYCYIRFESSSRARGRCCRLHS